jgi:hypothetical protein
MKKIWKFLLAHIQEDFNYRHYLTVFLLLVFSIGLNFWLDFEDKFLDSYTGVRKLLAYFAMYASLYYVSVWSYKYWNPQKHINTGKTFWIHSLVGIFLLSLDSSVPFLDPFIRKFFAPQLYVWTYKVSINLVSFLTVFFPLVLFYYLYERHEKNIYGLNPSRFDARPYLAMLALMFPIIVLASFHPSFLRQYPMYLTSSAHTYLGVPEAFTVAGYELVYGLDFITVEFLFRGFFVVGMIAFLGRGAVLSMAVIYCSLHFGKPLGEALSSIVGGYILGVVAFETRSIWGGVIVHVGIAWTMELVAYAQELLG